MNEDAVGTLRRVDKSQFVVIQPWKFNPILAIRIKTSAAAIARTSGSQRRLRSISLLKLLVLIPRADRDSSLLFTAVIVIGLIEPGKWANTMKRPVTTVMNVEKISANPVFMRANLQNKCPDDPERAGSLQKNFDRAFLKDASILMN